MPGKRMSKSQFVTTLAEKDGLRFMPSSWTAVGSVDCRRT